MISLFLTSFVAFGQDYQYDNESIDKLTFAQVDSLSYQYYLQADLRALKEITNESIAQGIDFFYLRSRLAIVAYNKQNYDLAYKHFQKASAKQPSDEVIQEYIFYSLKFNYRTEEAENYAKTLNPVLQQKLLAQKEPSIIPTLSIGMLFSPQTTSIPNKKGSAGIYAEGNLNGNMLYENLNMYFKLKKRSSLSLGISHYNTQTLGFVQTSFDNKTQDITNTQIQTDFYYRYLVKKGLLVGIGGAYYAINSGYYTSQFNPIVGYTYQKVDTKLNGYSVLANINKRMTYLNLGLQYSLYNVDKETQHQLGTAAKLYPLGNTKFTIGAAIDGTFAKSNHAILHLTSSVVPKKWLQITGDFYIGNMQNYISESGRVTFNTSDPIQQMISIRADFFYKKLIISPSLVLQKRESSYLQYSSFTNSQFQNYTYNTQLINLSLSWKF